jgi:hypothetical protein
MCPSRWDIVIYVLCVGVILEAHFTYSAQSLGGYVQDMVARLQYFHRWIATGVPNCIWISSLN